MIRWSFWVDAWEHPFNTWNRFYSVLIPLKSIEPGLDAIDPLPPKEHVDFGPWKGPPPGPIKPGIPKWTAEELAERKYWADLEQSEMWWLDPDYRRSRDDKEEHERPGPEYEYDRPQQYQGGEREYGGHPEHPWQDMNYGP